MLERALQQPFGAERDAQVDTWERIDGISAALLLDRPGEAVSELLGRDDPVPDDPLLVLKPVSNGDVPIGPAGVPWNVPTPEESPKLRTPSRAEPLRMWVAGDSMAGIFGQALVRMANGTGLISADLDYRLSTGLSRPDYFNWPAHLKKQAEERGPEVVVVVFGANDSQGVQAPSGAVYQPLSDGWRQEYARRVAGTMDLLHAPGRIVYWVGQPVAREADFTRRMIDLNSIYEREAASRPWVVYVDAFAVFDDENGEYTAYKTDAEGNVEQVREQDGVHLTWAGGERLAAVVLYQLGQVADLSAVATTEKEPSSASR
jgi:hypothetical protein